MDERTRNSLEENNRNDANRPVQGSREPVTGSQEPVSTYGDRRSTNSNMQQQTQQQNMNSQAQQQAAQRQQRQQPTIKVNGQDVPYFAAPRGHASESLYRLNARAREQERTSAQVDLPSSATNEALLGARVMPMPAGGIHALVSSLYPDDLENNDAMDQHVQDILNLNRDTLRDDTSHPVNAMIRVPGD